MIIPLASKVAALINFSKVSTLIALQLTSVHLFQVDVDHVVLAVQLSHLDIRRCSHRRISATLIRRLLD